MQVKAGLCMHESEVMHPVWVNCINQLGKFVTVPTHWNKTAFKRNGVVVAIEVINFGVNDEEMSL